MMLRERTLDPAERLANLESTVAFQDRTIEDLSQALASQQEQLSRLEADLRHLRELVRARDPLVRDREDEDPPPHY